LHELAIANSIVETVLAEVSERNCTGVVAIGLRIGELTDVVPEALEFGFEAITAGTLLEGTKLVIERTPVTGQCRDCAKSFVVREFAFVCPECNGAAIDLVQGNELDIAYVEVTADTTGTEDIEGPNDGKDID
jgi:hydrogenase nickel incorporation protein HypA/HybF